MKAATAALFGQPDMSGDYLFRARVARHLAEHWGKRANALKSCGEAGVKLRCECGEAHLVPYRCGARACPVCARAAAARTSARIANRVRIAQEARNVAGIWDGKGEPRKKAWKLLTLTSLAGPEADRFAPEILAERVGAVRRAWGPFWRSTPWGTRVRTRVPWQVLDKKTQAVREVMRWTKRARRDTMAVMGIEVAPGGMVHLHAAVYGEYVDRWELLALWRAALGEKVERIDVKALRGTTEDDFASALREVLKYVTKWSKKTTDREQRAAAIEAAMRGVRRIEKVGAIRAMPGVDEMLTTPDPDACNGCGRTDSDVRWVGIWDADKVKANGGFGPVVAALDDAERRKWRANPYRAKVDRSRDLHGDLSQHDAAVDAATDDAAGILASTHGE